MEHSQAMRMHLQYFKTHHESCQQAAYSLDGDDDPGIDIEAFEKVDNEAHCCDTATKVVVRNGTYQAKRGELDVLDPE